MAPRPLEIQTESVVNEAETGMSKLLIVVARPAGLYITERLPFVDDYPTKMVEQVAEMIIARSTVLRQLRLMSSTRPTSPDIAALSTAPCSRSSVATASGMPDDVPPENWGSTNNILHT